MRDRKPRILALVLALTAVGLISSISYAQDPVDPIEATINLRPKNLNLRSFGLRLTCFIELSEGLVEDIDVSTVELQILSEDGAEVLYSGSASPWPTALIDKDEDEIPDVLMVKFSRRDLVEYLNGLEEVSGSITLTVIGNVGDEDPPQTFSGEGTVRVKKRGRKPKK